MCTLNKSGNLRAVFWAFLWIKPTDALTSNFIGITTTHVSGSLSAHHQEFLAVHRFRYILCICDRLLPGVGWNCSSILLLVASQMHTFTTHVRIPKFQSEISYWLVIVLLSRMIKGEVAYCLLCAYILSYLSNAVSIKPYISYILVCLSFHAALELYQGQ